MDPWQILSPNQMTIQVAPNPQNREASMLEHWREESGPSTCYKKRLNCFMDPSADRFWEVFSPTLFHYKRIPGGQIVEEKP